MRDYCMVEVPILNSTELEGLIYAYKNNSVDDFWLNFYVNRMINKFSKII